MENIQREHEWRDGYKVIEVFGTMTDGQQQQVLQLWASEGVVPTQQAWQRVHQVVCMIQDPKGIVCGVSTAYLDKLRPGGYTWYLMRMFISPKARKTIGLPALASRVTRKHLARVSADAANGARGTAVINENPGLWKKGMHRHYEKAGWNFQEKLQDGREIWVCPFEGKWGAD
jgi:hypothetical protein